MHLLHWQVNTNEPHSTLSVRYLDLRASALCRSKAGETLCQEQSRWCFGPYYLPVAAVSDDCIPCDLTQIYSLKVLEAKCLKSVSLG